MSVLNRKKPKANLHQHYNINLQIGFIAALIIMIAMFRVNLNFSSDFEITVTEQEVIAMEEVIRTEQQLTPPPPPRPPAPEPVPDDEIVEDMFYNLDTEMDLDAPLDLPPPPPPEEEEEEEPEVFIIVQDMPELIGGMDAIYQNLRYPEIARQAGIEGRVVVRFVIDEEGRVTNPEIIRGIGGGCNEAAIAAVQQVRFTPGRQRGRAVKVQYTIPIVFRLQS